MRRRTLHVAALLALAAALTGTTATASAATPPPPPAAESTARLKGSAHLDYPVANEEIRVSVDARATFTKDNPWYPTKTEGTFRLSHTIPQPDGSSRTYWAEMEVDCLTTGGPNATVTGRIVAASNNPGDPFPAMLKDHVRLGMSFYVPGKGAPGPARVGLSGAADMTLSKCMAPAPFDKVVSGGFTLKS
ncbi:hypothetical protein [Streptomyces sp. NPDC056387]|uniref:hypothetical protein n=1 Tax=Streptomyces sp. NPDC056387 TaxID=3345803 RepID=UPI0035D7C377